MPTYKEQIENIKGKDFHTYGFLGYPVLQTADIVIYGEEGLPLIVPVGEDQVAHVEISARNCATHLTRTLDLPERQTCLTRRTAALIWDCKNYLESRRANTIKISSPTDTASLQIQASEMGIGNFLEKTGENRRFFSNIETLREPEVLLTQAKRVPGT